MPVFRNVMLVMALTLDVSANGVVRFYVTVQQQVVRLLEVLAHVYIQVILIVVTAHENAKLERILIPIVVADGVIKVCVKDKFISR